MGNMSNPVKTPHTIMLTYDRIETVEVDLPIETLRGFYGAGCLEEHFLRWIPERFAMTTKFRADDDNARSAAIELTIRALYRTIPKSKVSNLEV